MLEGLSIPRYVATRDNALGADNQQERPVGRRELARFAEGHDFSRAVTVAKSRGLEPLRFASDPAGILRDCMPDSNSKLEKIQSELHGDMQRVAEMSTPPRLERIPQRLKPSSG